MALFYEVDLEIVEDQDIINQDKILMSINSLRADVLRINADDELSQDQKTGMIAANDEATQGLVDDLHANYPAIIYTLVEV